MSGGCAKKVLLLLVGLMICCVPICEPATNLPSNVIGRESRQESDPGSLRNGGQMQMGGLPPAIQVALSSEIGDRDPAYHLSKDGGRYRGANGKNDLEVDFDADGVVVHIGDTHWGMRLVGVGYGDALRPLDGSEPKATTNRVEYSYGEITEWYVNSPLGVEQGFTIRQTPHDRTSDVLTLALALSGDLVPSLDETRTGVTLARRDGSQVLKYGGLYAYDAAGRHLPAWMEVDEARVLVRVDDRAAQYPIVVDPWIQQAKLTAPYGAHGEIFGFSVAVSGDGSTALIGATGGNAGKGAAYIFKRSGATWSYCASLLGPDSAYGDRFGSSVALSTDGTVAIVGAYWRNEYRGGAYVFAVQNQTWLYQGSLPAPSPVAYDYFGSSVALNASGDTALVGAYGKNSFQGVAYVFTRSALIWSYQAALTDASGAQYDALGYSVALSADGNTALIGAPYCSGNLGKAKIYTRSGAAWTPQADVWASDGVDYNGNFGMSVALSADGNTGLVGAQRNAADPPETAAYLFSRSGSTWTQSAEMKLPSTNEVPRFGAVALSADGRTALLGAWEGNYNKGVAFIYAKSGSEWIQRARLTIADGVDGDRFGDSVALNSDGTTAIVGARFALNYDGAAYVFTNAIQSDAVGVFRPSDGTFYLDANASGTWEGCGTDRCLSIGMNGDIPLVGDWNGSGTSKVGAFRPSDGTFYLDYNGSGTWEGCGVDRCLQIGMLNDIPLVGDWDGTGSSKVGVFRPSDGTFYLDHNGNGVWEGCGVDRCLQIGMNGDVPLVGDWNGSGTSKVGAFRPSDGTFYLDYNGNGQWGGCSTDRCLQIGQNGDIPLVGDWNGSGTAKVGVFRPSDGTFYLDYNGSGTWEGCGTDKCLQIGMLNDTPLVGDWNGSGTSKVGVFRPSDGTFYLDYNGSGTWEGCSTDRCLQIGMNGDEPLVGKW